MQITIILNQIYKILLNFIIAKLHFIRGYTKLG
jgi:hypothetical protein